MRQKEECLDKILRESGQDQCIVFVNTKRMCNSIKELLKCGNNWNSRKQWKHAAEAQSNVLAKGRLQDTEVWSEARRLTQEWRNAPCVCSISLNLHSWSKGRNANANLWIWRCLTLAFHIVHTVLRCRYIIRWAWHLIFGSKVRLFRCGHPTAWQSTVTRTWNMMNASEQLLDSILMESSSTVPILPNRALYLGESHISIQFSRFSVSSLNPDCNDDNEMF